MSGKNIAVDMDINSEKTAEILTGFIKDCFEKTGCQKAVIGLSGGLDSTVAAALSVNALGKDRVIGVIMPYKESSPSSREDAEFIASFLGIESELVDITTMVDAYFENYPGADPSRRGNVMARQRMMVLYDVSARDNGLVIGTSNKSEILLGYGTIFGDLACAINPVGDIYKTQERAIAAHLNIPDRILKKTPTADLVAGQTDEGDLGFSYEEVDPLMYLMVDERYTDEELLEKGFSKEFIDNVRTRIKRNHYKRIPPLIAKVSKRTIGHEFRYSWDWSVS